MPSSCAKSSDRACRVAGFEPKIAFESDEYKVHPGLRRGWAGRDAAARAGALPTLRSDLVVRPTDPTAPERRVWAATRAEGARSPATEAMVEILVGSAQAFALRSRERLRLVA